MVNGKKEQTAALVKLTGRRFFMFDVIKVVTLVMTLVLCEANNNHHGVVMQRLVGKRTTW